MHSICNKQEIVNGDFVLKLLGLERSHSWSSAAVLKTAKGASSSRVRISPSPRMKVTNRYEKKYFKFAIIGAIIFFLIAAYVFNINISHINR